jgi:aminoglycoside phosphotransferase (APT) family kinase protein
VTSLVTQVAAVERLLHLGPEAAQGVLVDEPAGLRLARAQLGSGATSLLLAGPSGGEWVLHWPADGQPAAWRWPADPELPVLHRPAGVPDILTGPGWSPAVPVGEIGAIDRVGYKPGRRATFRVELGSRRYVLKLVCRADLPAALHAGRFAAVLPAQLAQAPGMVASSEVLGAVLLDYLPGTPLDRLEPAERGEPLAAVPGLLAGLHAGSLDDLTAYEAAGDGLPAWDAGQVTRKLDALIAAVDGTAPGVAAAARQVAAAIAGRLAAAREPGVVMHGDLSLRNLVLSAAAPPGTPRLGVIDWDRAAIGPREADLSPLVGLLGAAAGSLVEDYERASGRPVDHRLLDALVGANRLARTLRRAASGRDGQAQARAVVATIAAGLRTD